MAGYKTVASLPRLEEAQTIIDDGELMRVDEVVWDIDLPSHLNPERIFINIARCRTMHKVGLFVGSVMTAYQGEVSEYSPSLTRMNNRGQIIPIFSGITKQAAIARGDTYTIDTSFTEPTPRTLGTTAILCVNKAEAARRVADILHDDPDENSALLWGQELDVALRQAMRKAGARHLLGPDNSHAMRYAALHTLTAIPGLIKAE